MGASEGFGFCKAKAVIPMGSTAVEKTEEELRNEIDELLRQQREVLSLSAYSYLCLCVEIVSYVYLLLL